MTERQKTRVFIYGSCVSRDTFELLDPARYALLAYVARQSLISAFGPATHLEAAPDELSPFQRRMVEGDLRGDLRTKLAAAASAVDILLWDLTDERLGVYRTPGGGFVTRTPDVITTNLEHTLAHTGTLIGFGTSEHLGLWRDATHLWVRELAAHGLLDRVLVLGPEWAEHTTDGSPAPASFGLVPKHANALYMPYYQHLGHLGFSIATVDACAVAASAEHQWGLAPFHYDQGTYSQLITAIDAKSKKAHHPATRTGRAHED